MQQVNSTLLSRLQQPVSGTETERKPAELVEFYANDYIPDSSGFDPADAVETFAAIEITWNGIAYRRETVSRGDISRSMGQQSNSVSITFSNIDRYLAAWAQTTDIEGMWLVIRYVERDITSDSVVLFAGKAGKPSTINNKSFSISATQDFLSLTAELPLRSFVAEDPNGRDPSDVLYEGIRFVAISGTHSYPEIIPAQNFFAGLIGQRDTRMVTKGWSTQDGTPHGAPIAELLGQAQIQLIPFLWADRGEYMAYNMAAGRGRIEALEQIKSRTSGFSDPLSNFNGAPPFIYLGDPGGTGSNANPSNQFPTAGYFSGLAYISGGSTGTRADVEDEPPVVTAVYRGLRMPVPNSSGVYASDAWTDNPANITRWVFTATGTPEGLMDDAECYQTSLFCDQPLLDESNSERVFIPSTDFPEAGNRIRRFNSSGRLNSRIIRARIIGDLAEPGLIEEVYEPLDLGNIPGTFVAQRFHRKRYTFNAPITERVKATDFLYKIVYPTFRGYHVITGKGKVAPRSEKASDNAILRSDTAIGATSIPVDDVTPWKTSTWGRLLIGYGLTTSEVRKVTSADYTSAANAITLTTSASGISSSASGATLGSGSTTVQAFGTVTLSGTPANGASVTVTINGIAITYTLDAYDTLASAVIMLAMAVNADTRLNRFISATYAGAVLTIKAKWGTLNLNAALANVHTGPLANPTVATVPSISAGTLAAGVYKIAYANVSVIGTTLISPIASATLVANQKIDIPAMGRPAGVTARNWYVSESPGSDKLIFYTQNTGQAFSITSLPSKDNPGIPAYNSTGEEALRIAMPFSSNSQGSTVLAQSGLTRANIMADSYNFPLGSEQSSINQIKGKFRDAANDWALTDFKVNDKDHQAQISKTNPLEVDLTGVDNWHQAFRLANGLLSKYREGDWFNSLKTGTGEALLLEEGDLITASDDSGEHINVCTRIESLSISPTWEVTIRRARRYSTLMFSDDVRQHIIPLPTTLRYVQTIDTNFVPLDIPIWRESDAQLGPGIYVPGAPEAGEGDWRGWYVYSDYTGEDVALTGKLDTINVLGDALTVLSATTNVTTIDTSSTGRVQITSRGNPDDTYPLVSTTEDKMLRGANLAAWGAPGRWELVNFQDADLVAGTTDTYDISTFLRGRHGTEANTSNHQVGDRFVLLTDADGNDMGVKYVPLPLHLLEQTFNLTPVTVNQDVADATPQSFTWSGLSRKDLAPVIEPVTRDTDGDILIPLALRARVGGGLRANQGGSVSEEAIEAYVQILDKDNGYSETLPNGEQRIMKVTPGMPLAAFLVSNQAGNLGVDQNSVNQFSSNPLPIARSIYEMEVPGPGNFVEASLEIDANLGQQVAMLGLQRSGGVWNDYDVTRLAYAVQLDGLFDITEGVIQRLHVYEHGNLVFTASSSATYPGYDPDFGWSSLSDGRSLFKVRFEFVGSSVVIKKAHTQNAPLTRIYTGVVPTQFPIFAVGSTGGGTNDWVRNITLSVAPRLMTIYDADQLREDFNLGPSDPLPTSVAVRAWQHSATIGRGQTTTKLV